MNRAFALFSAGVLATGVLVSGASAAPDCVPADLGQRWKMPIEYRIGDGLDREAVRAAVRSWESVSVRFLETEHAHSAFVRAQLGGDDAGQAYTETFVDERRQHWITRFTIVVDAHKAGAGIQAVLAHETGHALGLRHVQAGCGSVMQARPVLSGPGRNDTAARDRLYPVQRVYLPAISR